MTKPRQFPPAGPGRAAPPKGGRTLTPHEAGGFQPGSTEGTTRAELNALRFDALVSGPEKLWGLGCIARAIGVSESTVRRWADEPDVPIYQPSGAGRYFALRSELNLWLKRRSA